VNKQSRFAGKALLIALPLLCALALQTGCSWDGAGRYHSREHAFSIAVPEKWETRENHMGTAVIFLSPRETQNDLFLENLNIVVERLPAGTERSSYLNESVKNMARMLEGFKSGKPELYRLHRYDAGRAAYSDTLGTLRLESTVTMVACGGKAYVITCTSTKEDFPRYREIFEKTTGSFRAR